MSEPREQVPLVAPRKRFEASTLLILAVALFLFRDFLFFGGVFFKRDVHLVWHPQVEGVVRAVASGSLPLWDPSPAFGQPLLGDPSAQVAYPPTWLNLLMRPWVYYTAFAVAHFLLAAFGMRALARRLGLAPLGSTVAALAWALSGPFLSMVDLWHHYAGAAWLPWVAWSADRAFGGRRRETALLAFVLALQIVAGSADLCAMSLLLVAVLFFARHFDWRRPAAPPGRAAALRGLAGLALALGASALLWLPALDLVSRAARAELPQSVRSYWSLHPLVALETVLPGLWSTLPLSAERRALYFESREPFLSSLYLGVGVVALAAAGLARERRRLERTLAVAAGLALVVALGSHTPLYELLTTLLPPLRILRYPVKVAVLLGAALALLAGIGADALRERRPRAWGAVAAVAAALGLAAAAVALTAWLAPDAVAARVLALPPGIPPADVLRPSALRFLVTALLAGAAAALVALGRSGRLAAAPTAAALGALAVAELAAYHRHPNPVAPRALYTVRPEALGVIGDPGAARVYAYDYSVPGRTERHLGSAGALALARLPVGWTGEAAAALAMQMSLVPETGGRWGLSQVFGLDLRGLHPAPQVRLSQLLRQSEDSEGHLRLLRAGGTTHVLSYHAIPGLEPPVAIPGFYTPPLLVARVPAPLPRCYVVGAARRASDDETAALLVDPGFALESEVLLADGAGGAGGPGFHGGCRVASEASARMTLELELSSPGWVVLLDSWDPGWRVRLDGREAPLLRANLGFRAVQVPAGRHLVELAYRPRGLLAGAWAGVLSIATIGVLLGTRPRR